MFEVYKNARTAKSRLESEKRAYFPDGRGRKRNARAYLVADKLAQFYLYNVKNRPTYGTDYGAPSTEYQRALEKIFKIIGIEADTRGPAKALVLAAELNRSEKHIIRTCSRLKKRGLLANERGVGYFDPSEGAVAREKHPTTGCATRDVTEPDIG